jgi:imidazolonepropionase
VYGRSLASPGTLAPEAETLAPEAETLARRLPGRFDGAVPGPPRGAVAASNLATAGGSIATPDGLEPIPLVRSEDLGIASDTHAPAAVAWEDGVITYVGPAEGLVGLEPEWFEGCTIAPGFVDCHTHLPFVGWRSDEFEARLSGVSYRDLHGEGGIYRSARMFAEASDDEVLEFCRPLLQEMADHGTTALELKTGYGLSVEAELRQARLARALAEEAPQTCTVTLLACHAVPKGISREDWVRIACEELIPAAAAEGLADAIDVYVEDIAFTKGDLRAVAEAAAAHALPLRCHADQLGPSGAAEAAAAHALPLRCHADQLGPSGAAEAAVALGARSADHLNHVSPFGIAALGDAPATAAVLLPTSTLFMRASPPDVRGMLRAGAAVAIATDCNPGTSPVVSMPEAMAIACSLYGMKPLEALAAATIDPAWVLGLSEAHGTLSPGRRADLVILDGDAFRQVPYRPGHNPVLHTYIGGRRAGGR